MIKGSITESLIGSVPQSNGCTSKSGVCTKTNLQGMASSTSRFNRFCADSVQILRGVEDAAPYIHGTDGNNVNPKICDAPVYMRLCNGYREDGS